MSPVRNSPSAKLLTQSVNDIKWHKKTKIKKRGSKLKRTCTAEEGKSQKSRKLSKLKKFALPVRRTQDHIFIIISNVQPSPPEGSAGPGPGIHTLKTINSGYLQHLHHGQRQCHVLYTRSHLNTAVK